MAADATAGLSRELKDTGSCMARAADACDQLVRGQGQTQENIRALVEAVGKLPALADTLDQTVGRIAETSPMLLKAAEEMGSSAAMLSAIARHTESLVHIADNAQAIRTSLGKEIAVGDDRNEYIDAITAIVGMRDVLAKEMAEATRDSAKQIAESISSVDRAVDLVSGGLASLNTAFLKLAAAIQRREG
jgi:ABC-type transporter Mla subunit MlaD